jgi:FMN phosphatase YigB (HAD superfamily)
MAVTRAQTKRKNTMLIFDLDETLYNNTTKQFYPQIQHILEKLHKKYRISMASFNISARKRLEKAGLDYLFESIHGYKDPIGGKPAMINRILSECNMSSKNVIFFDNRYKNVMRVINEIQVHAILVCEKEGLSMYNVQDYM